MPRAILTAVFLALALNCIQAAVVRTGIVEGYCINCGGTQGPITTMSSGDCGFGGFGVGDDGRLFPKPVGLGCKSAGDDVPECGAWSLCCSDSMTGWFACVRRLTIKECELHYICVRRCCTGTASVQNVPVQGCGTGAFAQSLVCNP